MNVLVIVGITLALIVFLFQKKVSLGNTMLAGSLVLIVLNVKSITIIWQSFYRVMVKYSTWELIFTLYLVMCLEFMLRTSGVLDKVMMSARNLNISDRAMLGIMPAFLGLLPSLGGAIFSAPFVESAGKRYDLTPEDKTTINMWFRHIWEYINPIAPGILLIAELTKIPLRAIIMNFYWLTILSVILGCVFLLTGRKFKEAESESVKEIAASSHEEAVHRGGNYKYPLLALAPVFLNLFFVVVLKISPALSMLLVVSGMVIALRLNAENIRKMLRAALDLKMYWGVYSILLFQMILTDTSTVDNLVAFFKQTGFSVPLLIGITAYIIAILTGTSQGYVGIIFPIIAAYAPGNVNIVTIGLTVGLAGHMTSPSHLCYVVTLEYFKASYLKTVRTLMMLESVLIAASFLMLYLRS